jgi:hypothetical protein
MESNEEMTTLQSQNKTSLFKNALTYGLYTAAAYVLLSLMYYALNIHRITWLNNLSYLILIVGIILATINFRDKINGGYITYGKSFLTGLYISLVVSIIIAIYLWVYFTYINTDGIRELNEITEQRMVDRGYSDEMIDKQLEVSAFLMKMPFLNIITALVNLIIGIVISLLTSAFLKKNDDSFNATFSQ